MTPLRPTVYILPAEHVGAGHTEDGVLNVGGVEIPYKESIDGTVHVYVRRSLDDLSVMEIHITRHDGLAQEELDQQNREAAEDPRGPKEYWRSKSVGHFLYGADQHVMTDDDFEEEWADGEECGETLECGLNPAVDDEVRRRALGET